TDAVRTVLVVPCSVLKTATASVNPTACSSSERAAAVASSTSTVRTASVAKAAPAVRAKLTSIGGSAAAKPRAVAASTTVDTSWQEF
ncbi:hypothetical protein P2A63_04940, partial [Xanthomonas perforans]